MNLNLDSRSGVERCHPRVYFGNCYSSKATLINESVMEYNRSKSIDLRHGKSLFRILRVRIAPCDLSYDLIGF